MYSHTHTFSHIHVFIYTHACIHYHSQIQEHTQTQTHVHTHAHTHTVREVRRKANLGSERAFKSTTQDNRGSLAAIFMFFETTDE